MGTTTIYFDVAKESVAELDLMNKLYNAIFPINNGMCVKWTYERSADVEEEKA